MPDVRCRSPGARRQVAGEAAGAGAAGVLDADELLSDDVVDVVVLLVVSLVVLLVEALLLLLPPPRLSVL